MKNLKKLRMDRHLSQQKLADKFQLSQQSIYKYENNLAEPDIQTLKNFASFFHTSIDHLVGYSPHTISADGSSTDELTPDEVHFLLLYRNLPPSTKNHLTALLEELAKKD